MARPSSYKTPSGATRYRIRFQVDGQTMRQRWIQNCDGCSCISKEESAKLRLRMRNTAQLVNELIDRYYAGPFNELAPGTRKTAKQSLSTGGAGLAITVKPAKLPRDYCRRDRPTKNGMNRFPRALFVVCTGTEGGIHNCSARVASITDQSFRAGEAAGGWQGP